MTDTTDALIERFLLSSSGFARRLRSVRAEQWTWPTLCTEWNVQQLVNHMTRGNLSYVRLLDGGDAAEFLLLREADALGTDPVRAYEDSASALSAAFGRAGALRRVLDYPLGPVSGGQALAVRITDSVIHTWDLAQAVGVDDTLDRGLVAWIDAHLDDIYAGLPETPVAAETTHRFFGRPVEAAPHASPQARLLHRMG
ncbi:MAG TPA: TIGR03086 family metal-binding protein, partial [Streptomyces sp.]|nr:TIGR03086 family metal-binding protein [Streptomyces sp.]